MTRQFINPRDAFMEACASAQWTLSSRRWRELAPTERDELAVSALFCSMDALRAMSEPGDRHLPDATLRAFCATLAVSSAQPSRWDAEISKSLGPDLLALGLWQCFVELFSTRPLALKPCGIEPLLSTWITYCFPSDAKAFLYPFSSSDDKNALAALRLVCQIAEPSDQALLNYAHSLCERAAKRYWPDERSSLARSSCALFTSPKGALPSESAPSGLKRFPREPIIGQ